MNKIHIILSALLLSAAIVSISALYTRTKNSPSHWQEQRQQPDDINDTMNVQTPHPLSIMSLKNTEIKPSSLQIEQTLSDGSNYNRYIASYFSEGLKQYGLLTIPKGKKPSSGWPAIIFNHGYIPPQEYKTTEKYIAYTDAFSRNGYVLFRPDYRGHDKSEGIAEGGYGSNAYTIDVLHAYESIKLLPDVNPEKVGMWGHSMGGHITLRSMVVNPSIKAGVIWAGVVASYPDLINNWRRGTNTTPPPLPSGARRWRQTLTDQYGAPEQNPEFWNSLSSTSYLSDISGPVQIHHGTGDDSVPYEFSTTLDTLLKKENKTSELYLYQGDDHNISRNFSTAINRSIAFFDTYLKE